MGNRIRTAVLLATMTAFIVAIGHLLGGRQGMVIAFVIAAGMNFFSYWYSDTLVLKMYRASEISPQQAPDVYRSVQSLAQRAGLPMPRVFLIPQKSPNAFATGRDPQHAVVAVTEGLLQIMDKNEIEGVLAHELAHINNRDILIGSIAATMAGAIVILASMARWSAIFGGGSRNNNGGGMSGIGLIVMSLLAPMAAALIQMAISRSREYLADDTGARFAGNPEGLARALEKLAAQTRHTPLQANPSTAHMFIVNPLRGGKMAALFSTHPPVAERVARLRGGTASPTPTESPSPQADQRHAQARAFWDRMMRK
jgi:heat shock protein HtpX